MRFIRIRIPTQGGSAGEVTSIGPKESDPRCHRDVKGEEGEEVGDEGSKSASLDSLLVQGTGRKRRRREKPMFSLLSPKHERSGDRWSSERYKRAERSLLEILKAEGAIFGNPISRPLLRVAGRQRIGDTGLLDHLLKHIDGKVAPDGLGRFRRWFNTDGVMEYWLESAELADIRREAGVDDPYWVPPSWWKPGSGPLQPPASASEFKLLRDDMAIMKRDLEHFACKKQDPDHTIVLEELRKEFLGWKAKTEQRLMELSSSLSGMQDIYRDLVTWKCKTEQQLIEISNSLSSMQATKQPSATTLSPNSEKWEDWLENNNNLENLHGEDIPASWFECADAVNHEVEVTPQKPCPSLSSQFTQMDDPAQEPDQWKEMDALREEVEKLRRELTELASKKQEDDTHVRTKNASAFTLRQKAEPDTSLILLQGMLKELAKWKAKMEQQLMDVSAAVGGMQAPVPVSSFGQSRIY